MGCFTGGIEQAQENPARLPGAAFTDCFTAGKEQAQDKVQEAPARLPEGSYECFEGAYAGIQEKVIMLLKMRDMALWKSGRECPDEGYKVYAGK